VLVALQHKFEFSENKFKFQRINQIKRKDVQEPNEHIKGTNILG
jgi:hypothetical protein